MGRRYLDSWRTHVQAVMDARVGDAPHFGSTCPPLDTRPRCVASLVAVRGSIRID